MASEGFSPGDLVYVSTMNDDPLMIAWRKIYGLGIVLAVSRSYVTVHFLSDVGFTSVVPEKLEKVQD